MQEWRLQPYSFQTLVKVVDPFWEVEEQPWKHASTLTDSTPATFPQSFGVTSFAGTQESFLFQTS